MAEPRRFPNIVLPFALVGAAAGWLSVGLLANPLLGVSYAAIKPLAALCTMLVAVLTGAVITKLCGGGFARRRRKKYPYELETPEEPEDDVRPRSDRALFHVIVSLAAGALAGAIVASLDEAREGALDGAASGFVCSFAFVPVALAVIVSARRSKRARFGSIVADSDRRAVWGILATALGLATLLAIVDWPAARFQEASAPTIALWMLHAAAVVTFAVLLADIHALRRAQKIIGPGLSPREEGPVDEEDPALTRLDLGLGEDLLSRLARRGSAYRARDRAVALVRGNPDQALDALRRAIRRGVFGLALLAFVYGAHGLATTEPMARLYLSVRCERFPKCDSEWMILSNAQTTESNTSPLTRTAQPDLAR